MKPRMGDALLFWSMRPDASLDPSSLHGELHSRSLMIRKITLNLSFFNFIVKNQDIRTEYRKQMQGEMKEHHILLIF